MPRYHFNLTDGQTIEDPEGQHCETLEDAMRVAVRTAKELGKNRSDREIFDLNICVTDEEGRQVFTTPLVNT